MNIQQVDELIEEGNSLQLIARAYSEIANLKIKRIRSEVLRNREFFDEILKIYGTVKAFAIKRGAARLKPKKRLAILLTSNYRFYGNINSSLTKYFAGSVRELPDVDKIILGKGGIDYFRATKILPKYQEVILKGDIPTSLELINLVNLSTDYNQVLVFHSKLKTLLLQQPTFTDITATSLYTNEQIKTLKGEDLMHFIFEPDLPKILNFFENQILTLLLEQTFLESELSRTASRFISMDQAETEANKFIDENLKLKSHIQTSIENKKILENFAILKASRKGTQING